MQSLNGWTPVPTESDDVQPLVDWVVLPGPPLKVYGRVEGEGQKKMLQPDAIDVQRRRSLVQHQAILTVGRNHYEISWEHAGGQEILHVLIETEQRLKTSQEENVRRRLVRHRERPAEATARAQDARSFLYRNGLISVRGILVSSEGIRRPFSVEIGLAGTEWMTTPVGLQVALGKQTVLFQGQEAETLGFHLKNQAKLRDAVREGFDVAHVYKDEDIVVRSEDGILFFNGHMTSTSGDRYLLNSSISARSLPTLSIPGHLYVIVERDTIVFGAHQAEHIRHLIARA